MNLLLDMGNSLLKWAVEHDGRMGEIQALDYGQDDFSKTLLAHWQAMESPEKLAIASVSKPQVLTEVAAIGQSLWPDVELVVPQSSRHGFGLTNAYAQPEKLGVDRWLAMIAAHSFYAGPICVVDCGTAITVDVVRGDGEHAGGLICPGLRLMKKALAANTAALAFDNQVSRADLATETGAAIANGVLLAAAGMIQQVMARLAPDCRLVMTGGDAQAVAGALAMPAVIDHALVLKGLSLFCTGEQTA